jgi:hypothetical protein
MTGLFAPKSKNSFKIITFYGGGFQVFLLDPSVNLLPQYYDMGGGFDAQADLPSPNLYYGDADIVPDKEAFAEFAG